MFVEPENDAREDGPSLGGERSTLVEYVRCQRATLELKCSGLGVAELDCRSVEPSTLSLLGLVRHMAEIERPWFREKMARMVEEYARHNGHADLLRERIDGAIGQ